MKKIDELLEEVLFEAFENHYDVSKILALGKAYIGKSFQVVPRQNSFQCNYLGEIFSILRHIEMPIRWMGELVMVHEGYSKHSTEFKVMEELTEMMAADTRSRRNKGRDNYYHNEAHSVNVLMGVEVLGLLENLKAEDHLVNLYAAPMHDILHPMIGRGPGGTYSTRLEELACERVGIVKKDRKVVVLPYSPLRRFDNGRKIRIGKKLYSRVLHTQFHENAKRVERLYRRYEREVGEKKRIEVPSEVAAAAVLCAADLLEAKTCIGNLITGSAMYREKAFEYLSDEGLASPAGQKKAGEMLLRLIQPEGRVGFIKDFAPPYTKAERLLGVPQEVEQAAEMIMRGGCGPMPAQIDAMGRVMRDKRGRIL